MKHPLTDRPESGQTLSNRTPNSVRAALRWIRRYVFDSIADTFRRVYDAVWNSNLRVSINDFLFYFLKLLQQTWSTVLLLLIVWSLFTRLEQAIDFLEDFGNKYNWVKFSSYAAAFVCTMVTWFGTRLQFLFYGQEFLVRRSTEPRSGGTANKSETATEKQEFEERKKTISTYVRFTPPVLGAVPLLILLSGFAKVGYGLGVVVTLVLVLVYLAIIGPVTNYLSENGEDDSGRYAESKFSELRPLFQRLVYFIWGGCGLFFLGSVSFWVTLRLSRFMGLVAVAFLAFSVWIWILTYLNIANYRLRLAMHLVLITALVATLVYPNNNNHSIRTLPEDAAAYLTKKHDTLTIRRYFRAWADNLVRDHQRRGVALADTTLPVYLVAAEGGGIRAAFWTAGVLAELEKLGKDKGQFTPHVFAISGVSGGSLGASLFTALYHDALRDTLEARLRYDLLTDRFMRQDYLAPLLTAGLGPDMLQKFLFFKVGAFDRARYLEDGWEHEYQQIMPNSQTFGESFYGLWRSGDRGAWNYRVPILFLNSTHVQRGQKALLTPLRFDRNPYFTDVVDIQEQVRRSLSLKTATSVSARFPIFTPPAVVNDPRNEGEPAAHYVDGGYIDNSGLETALSVLSTLIDDNVRSEPLSKPLGKPVKLHVIFIKNSDLATDSTDVIQPRNAVHRFYELTDPAKAFYNSWDNSVGPKLALARRFLKEAAHRTKAQKQSILVDPYLYVLDLERGGGRIPLGWQLSKPAANRIARQLKDLSRRPNGDFPLLEELMIERKNPPLTGRSGN